MDTYADDLSELLEALDLSGATLVGHSAGGGEVASALRNMPRPSTRLQVSANGSVRGVYLSPGLIRVAVENAALIAEVGSLGKPLNHVFGVRIPASQPHSQALLITGTHVDINVLSQHVRTARVWPGIGRSLRLCGRLAVRCSDTS
jgi:pimeloyl-ACP methyl ester carboxylesterase